MRISLAGVALTAVAAAVLAGCSKSAAPPPPQDTGKMTQYARCMQQYGVDIPFPEEGEPAGGLFTLSTTDPKVLAARSACARFEPVSAKQGMPDPADEERVLRLAQCLRAEGIKAKDPAPGKLTVTLENGATPSRQQLVDAYTACTKRAK